MQPQHLINAQCWGRLCRRPAGLGLLFGSLVLQLLLTLNLAHAQAPYVVVWWTVGSHTQSQGASYTLAGGVHPIAPTLQGGNYRLGNLLGASVFQTPTTAPTAPLLTTTTSMVIPDIEAQTKKQYLPLIVAEKQ